MKFSTQKCLLALSLIITVLTSCYKSSPRHQTINADLIAAFNYKPGSYWIYKDSTSGREDSFYVSSNSGIFSTTGNDVTTDGIDIYITEIPIASFPGIRDTTVWMIGLSSDYLWLDWRYYKFGQKIDESIYNIFITYPFTLGVVSSKYYGSSGTNIVTNIYSSFRLNSMVFNTVALINSNDRSLYDNNGTNGFYINADVGIIKMQLNYPNDTINKVWEIERYNIVK